MQYSEKLVLKLASGTEKNLPHVHRIGTFQEKYDESHIESAKLNFFISLIYKVFEKRVVKKYDKNRSDRNQQIPKN